MKTPICVFCKNKCVDRDEADLVDDWWYCEPCQTHYRVHYTGSIDRVYMDTKLKGRLFSLQLMYDANESRIVVYPQEPDGTLLIAITFHYIVVGATPQNLQDKIRTYINFS